MPLVIMPDVVIPTIAWLNAIPQVTAIFGNRITTRLAYDEGWPALRIDPIGGDQTVKDRVDQPVLQIHSFALSDVAAMTGARTARAALDAMAGFRVSGQCVVRNVDTTSPQLLPDEDRTPTVSHATFTATVAVRPDP